MYDFNSCSLSKLRNVVILPYRLNNLFSVLLAIYFFVRLSFLDVHPFHMITEYKYYYILIHSKDTTFLLVVSRHWSLQTQWFKTIHIHALPVRISGFNSACVNQDMFD